MSDADEHAPGRTTRGVFAPESLAIASLVLGTLSLGGFGLANGSNYVLPLTQGQSDVTRTVLAGLLGALVALVAAVMGALAKDRVHPGDPAWVPRLAQAGVLVGGIAVVLRLIATSCSAAQVASSGFFAPL